LLLRLLSRYRRGGDMEEVREGPVEKAYRTATDSNKKHEVWYWELIKAQMPDLAHKLPDGENLAETEKRLAKLKGPEKERVRDIQQSSIRRLVELEVQNKGEHADTFIREGPIKSAITQFALSTGYITPKDLKKLIADTPTEVKTLDRFQRSELRGDAAKSQSMLEPVFPALYAVLDKMPIELLSVFSPARQLDKSKISIGELVTFNAIMTPIQLKMQSSGLKEQDINTLTTVTQLLTGALKNEMKFHQEIESRVNKASQQINDKSSQQTTAGNANVDSPEPQRPVRQAFFGRIFKKSEDEPDQSFRDMLKEKPPSTQPSSQKIPKLSDVEIASSHIDTVSRMMTEEGMGGRPLVRAIASACDRIEKTIDFNTVDRHEAEDLVAKLKKLYTVACNEMPEEVIGRHAEEIDRLGSRIMKIEENLEASSRPSPTK
jgi:hypothetical protein